MHVISSVKLLDIPYISISYSSFNSRHIKELAEDLKGYGVPGGIGGRAVVAGCCSQVQGLPGWLTLLQWFFTFHWQASLDLFPWWMQEVYKHANSNIHAYFKFLFFSFADIVANMISRRLWESSCTALCYHRGIHTGGNKWSGTFNITHLPHMTV